MPQSTEHRDVDLVPRTLWLLVAAALLATFAARVYLIQNNWLDEDETNILHQTWQMTLGRMIYVDFLDAHTPLTFETMRPVLWLGGRPSDLLLRGRWYQLPLAAAVFALLYSLARELAGRRAAWWTLLLAGCFNYFAFHGAEVRIENWLLIFSLGGLWQLAKWQREGGPAYRLGLGCALLALAAAINPMAVFLYALPPILLWTRPGRGGRAWWIWLATAPVLAALLLLAEGGVRVVELVRAMVTGWVGLRVVESHRTFNWFILRTFYTNPAFWLVGIGGFVALHFAIRRGLREADRRAGMFLATAGWLALLGLVLRQHIFQQQLILPGLTLALAGGWWLARWFEPAGVRFRPRHQRLVLALGALLLVSFVAETGGRWYHKVSTVATYRGVLRAYWNGPGPPETTSVETGPLLAFLRGTHDDYNYYPQYTLDESLNLADMAAAFVGSGGVVFSQAGLAIVRDEPYRIVKTSAVEALAGYEGEETSLVCRTLRQTLPGACDPSMTPGARLVASWQQRPPDLVIFHYAVIHAIVRYPETTAWYEANYQSWWNPKTRVFLGTRRDDPRRPD